MRHALRRLLASPAFTITAAVTLGFAIGANALIFSVVYGVILKPLPFADPDRLVGVWHVAPGVMPGPLNQAPSTYFTYREDGRAFEDIGMWDDQSVTITGRGEPEQVASLMVTDGTLPVLGVQPVIGRNFTPAEDAPGSPETVILSHAYWQRTFGGSPAAIGETLLVNGRPREIIGVLPADFRFLTARPAVVLPFRFNRHEIVLGQFSYQAVARLRPGVSIADANADIARLIPSLVERFPMPPGLTREMFESAGLGPLVRPLSEDVIGNVRDVLWILLGTVGIVLLVACANVANLFLVRAEGRRQELAVRLALGAGTRRLAGELLTESLLLGLAGGILGLGLAYGGLQLLVALEPAQLPRLDEIAIDSVVLVFTLVTSILTGLLFGVLPIVKYARPSTAGALKEGGRGSSDGRERHRARSVLVVAQVALGLVLLTASGLLIRTFVAMKDVAPGFVDPDSVLTLRITIPSALVNDPGEVARAHEQMLQRIEALPGVVSVGLSSSITMDGSRSMDPIFVEDFPAPEGRIPELRRFKWISPNHFATMGNRLVAGRDLSWEDIHTKRRVVLISENLARQHWTEPHQAIGRRLRNSPENPWREIIGVAGDERDDGVSQPPPSLVYWPMLMDQFWETPVFVQRGMSYAIRSSRVSGPGFLREVQRAVWSVYPDLPLARVDTLREIYDRSMAQTSFALVVLGIAAGGTLLLGVVGIYGVIAYIVAARRREVGIRMALGAAAGEVQRLFLTRGLLMTGLGLAIGAAAALATMTLLSALLYGVSPFDPATYAAVMVMLGAVSLLATWLPARQATRVDPAIALRGD